MTRVPLDRPQLLAVVNALSNMRNEIVADMRRPSQSEAQRIAKQQSYDVVESALFTCQEALRGVETQIEMDFAARDAKKVTR